MTTQTLPAIDLSTVHLDADLTTAVLDACRIYGDDPAGLAELLPRVDLSAPGVVALVEEIAGQLAIVARLDGPDWRECLDEHDSPRTYAACDSLTEHCLVAARDAARRLVALGDWAPLVTYYAPAGAR